MAKYNHVNTFGAYIFFFKFQTGYSLIGILNRRFTKKICLDQLVTSHIACSLTSACNVYVSVMGTCPCFSAIFSLPERSSERAVALSLASVSVSAFVLAKC